MATTPATRQPSSEIFGYAKFLIRLAWTVEIVAVLIGLTISVVVAVSAFQSFEDYGRTGLLDTGSAVLVASLPFVLIALVEICKIPLTFAFLAVDSKLWRTLFMGFVLFLCLITFETMFNGFERNFSNLNRAIDERLNNIERINGRVDLLQVRRNNIVRFSEEDVRREVEDGLSVQQAEYGRGLRSVEQNTNKALAEIDYSFEADNAAEQQRLELLLDQYYENWRVETAAVEERFSVLLADNLQGSADERGRLLNELEALKAEMEDALSRANFFTRSTIENKYRALVAAKEAQLTTITTGYLGADAIEKQSSMEAQLKSQLEFVNQKYSRRVEDVNRRLAEVKQDLVEQTQAAQQLQVRIRSGASTQRSALARIKSEKDRELNAYLEDKLTELETFMQDAYALDEEMFQLRSEQTELQTQINHLINQNQIYRLAMYAYGKSSPTEVDKGSVGVVGFIWFGSLSLIAAVCGVMLALAGFYLRGYLHKLGR